MLASAISMDFSSSFDCFTIPQICVISTGQKNSMEITVGIAAGAGNLRPGRSRTCSTASPWAAFVARCAGIHGPSSCGSTFRSLTDARGCGCQCAGYSGPSPTSRLCASYSRPAGRTSCVRPEQSRCRAARFLGALQTELSMRRSLAARGSTGSAPRRDRLRRAAACGRAPRAGWPRRAKRSAGIAAGHDTGA